MLCQLEFDFPEDIHLPYHSFPQCYHTIYLAYDMGDENFLGNQSLMDINKSKATPQFVIVILSLQMVWQLKAISGVKAANVSKVFFSAV